MKINIKTASVELSPEIYDYLNKKVVAFDKLINKKDESAALSVILAKTSRHHQKGDIFKAEMNLHTSGNVFQASVEEHDLFAAIDIVKDEILKELKKNKEKKIDGIKKPAERLKRRLRRRTNNHLKKSL